MKTQLKFPKFVCIYIIVLVFFAHASYSQHLFYCEQSAESPEQLKEEETLCEKYDRFNCQINISSTTSSALGLAGYYNKTICISGLLIINSNFYFDACTIKMAHGSQISVEAGYKLTVSDSELFACEEMWKGILVKESGLIVFFDNEIEDAQYGLELIKPHSATIYNNTFDRNYEGIVFKQSGILPPTPFYVKGNRFYCTSPLNAPYSGQIPLPQTRTFCGIRAMSHPFLTIDGYYDPLLSQWVNNNFENLRDGIICLSSNITISHSSFTNMINEGVHEGFLTGIGIYGFYENRIKHTGLGFDTPSSTFRNCQRAGIYTNACSLSTSESLHRNIGLYGINCTNQYLFGSTINNNKFILSSSSTLNNIYLEKGLSESFIKENVINQPNYYSGKIEVKNPSGYSSMVTIEKNNIAINAGYGIEISSDIGDGFIIDNNHVDGLADNNLGYGIFSWNNSGSDYTIKSNHCFSGHYSGIQGFDSKNTFFCNNYLYDNFIGLALKYSHAGSTVSRNEFFGTNDFGLNMQHPIMLGDQRHRGNIWNGIFSAYAAVYSNPPLFMDSRFYVNNIVPGLPETCYFDKFLPNNSGIPSYFPLLGWFIPEIGDSCRFCIGFFTAAISENWEEAIGYDGGQEAYGYSQGAKWDAESFLYSSIMKDPGSYTDPLYYDALERISQYSLIPEWYEINSLFKSAADGPIGFTESHAEIEATILEVMQQMYEIETAYYESGDLPDQWHILAGELESHLAQSRELGETYSLWMEEKFSSIENLLQNLTPETLMDAAMLEYMLLKISIMKHPENYNDNLESIIALAQKCYDQNGPAPLMAVSFLPSCMQGDYIQGEYECIQSEKNTLSATSNTYKESRISLQPNPANNEVQVIGTANSDKTEIEVYLFNQIGQVVYRGKVNTGDRIQIAHLPSGTYTALSISSEGKEFHSMKFLKL